MLKQVSAVAERKKFQITAKTVSEIRWLFYVLWCTIVIFVAAVQPSQNFDSVFIPHHDSFVRHIVAVVIVIIVTIVIATALSLILLPILSSF